MYPNSNLPSSAIGGAMDTQHQGTPQDSSSPHPNDVHYSGGLFARIPHEFLKDVKDPIAIAVYNHLMMYADWNSGLAHPNRERLAKALDYKTTRPVDNAIKHLVEKGWIKTFPRWKKFDEETGRVYISYDPQGGFAQTSNGYVVYDKKQGVEISAKDLRGGSPTEAEGEACGTPPQVPGGHTNKNHLNKNHLTNKDMLISEEKSVTPSNSTEVSEPGKETTQASEKKTPGEKYPKEFLEWYNIYPRKKAKGDALKAYKQALKEIDHDALVEKTRKFARYVEQSQTPAQYVPYPATWLRASQWDDELETPEALNQPGTGPGGSGARSARDKSAEQLLREQWAREDAYLNNTNQQPQSAIFEWPYGAQREIEQ